MGAHVLATPCSFSEALSQQIGGRVYLKLENLQRTGSFKERGAANKLALLTDEERKRGVICASAGNHAQGVAAQASQLGIAATIVMPERSPLNKVQRTKSFGVRVVLHGQNYDEAYEEAMRIRAQEGQVFVHPFDDDAIIAGQGTLGLEILEQVPDVEAVVVAIGGGGLAAGIGVAIKDVRPDVRVFGVQTAALPSMIAARAAGAPVLVPAAHTLAEGIGVRRAGARTFELVSKYVDDIVTVDDEEIAEAILVLLEREKTVAEGAGAAPIAAILKDRLPLRGKTVVGVLCGGNIDVTVLSRIIERGLVQSGRLFRLGVRVPDIAGSLARLATLVAGAKANVVEIHHDRAFEKANVSQVVVELTLETRGFEHIDEIGRALTEAGYELVPRGHGYPRTSTR
ncbi:MAG: threonine ammonia-lyase [Polyangiaceae bacterium]